MARTKFHDNVEAFLDSVPGHVDTEMFCAECGDPMFHEQGGVSRHGTPDAIDHDADEHHTPIDDSTY